ncbi:DNA polymerase III subunit gamma/tau [Candidatus Pelagibacter sp. RS39]|uniref:DNA polymerase III subunit gamma/tau n=1 Tax=Candidatus Pelagibacter sp. RS39 TaxID=1977864 RepID=UPI000A162943|nr:DNA polymerase III subunit gamma/tau [Candidatus Pelagibacter sp. RS39]ARJ47453.1 DNA polymerase III, subunit gamma and tau [Candidatus Pelagibacter sp. RS39]
MSNDTKVLALKYRPQNFDDLIGQDVVAETITNSIVANKVPNAYLFTGIRGVGKTTIARIVAKALNCKNGIQKNCQNKCDNCQAITNSNHIDVLEMDAASRTGVDDVRELIEFSRYGPTSSKYKIFIIDEVHMLSKQAFNALLKTLEEPPEYLKFIFATTEIKKIPVTVISRCQRFDLSRIKSSELFNYIKNIKDKEGGKITDDALKLIVKISEGSVRDALSLLDRALLTLDSKTELDLKTAQKIFGFFDKSQLIDLFEFILNGDEIKVIEIYRKIYDQGVEPKIFINDFLELLYYFKNIKSLTLESTNFSLNDQEFQRIKDLNKNLDPSVLILFWQFTISTLDELVIVSNQHLSMEMFLLRLIYLSSIKLEKNTDINSLSENPVIDKEIYDQSKPINQIKNIYQEEKSKPEIHKEIKSEKKIFINNLEKLIQTCVDKKEIKLKYELEKNVNLVKFEKNIIEISFNENLDKNFVKELSSKLFEWTGERWMISFSQLKGDVSMKEKRQEIKKSLIEEIKSSKTYKDVIKNFPDAELIDVNLNKEDEPHD